MGINIDPDAGGWQRSRNVELWLRWLGGICCGANIAVKRMTLSKGIWMVSGWSSRLDGD